VRDAGLEDGLDVVTDVVLEAGREIRDDGLVDGLDVEDRV